MPMITYTSGAMSPETRAKLVRRLTEVAAEVTGISTALFFVALHVLPDDNAAVGGETVTELRRRLAAERLGDRRPCYIDGALLYPNYGHRFLDTAGRWASIARTSDRSAGCGRHGREGNRCDRANHRRGVSGSRSDRRWPGRGRPE